MKTYQEPAYKDLSYTEKGENASYPQNQLQFLLRKTTGLYTSW